MLTPEKDRWANRLLNDLVNKDTDILKQIIHNSQKTNVDAPWTEISGKKRNRQTAPKYQRRISNQK